MVWPEISIEEFPPERDDEPSSLRQDIIDELSDHFTCALNRELLKNSDMQTAKQRVLNQFGDPIKIARQLWFDAMKESIMSQRIMTGVSVAMAVCGFIVVGLVWSMVNESQSVNARMMEQLLQAQTNSEADTARDMFNISFQLVQDNDENKPAVGFIGKLTKNRYQNDSFTLDAISDETGKLDFGKLPWGSYELALSAPWGEDGPVSSVSAIPGRDYSQAIVCPAAPPEELPVKFRVNWTEKLKSGDWVLLCDFRPPRGVNYSMRKIGETQWYGDIQKLDQEIQSPVYIIDKNNQVSLCPLDQQGEFKDLASDALTGESSINILERNDYRLAFIYLLQKHDLDKLSFLNSSKSFNLIELENREASIIPASLNKNILRIVGFREGVSENNPRIAVTSILLPFKKLASIPDVNDSVLSGLPSLTNFTNGVILSEKLGYAISKNYPNIWEISLPDLESIPLKLNQ